MGISEYHNISNRGKIKQNKEYLPLYLFDTIIKRLNSYLLKFYIKIKGVLYHSFS